MKGTPRRNRMMMAHLAAAAVYAPSVTGPSAAGPEPATHWRSGSRSVNMRPHNIIKAKRRHAANKIARKSRRVKRYAK